jgi:ATP-dependent DNA ligase
VVLFCFDCLYVDGEVLLKKSLRERREALYKAIVPQEGKVQFATSKTSKDVDELQVNITLASILVIVVTLKWLPADWKDMLAGVSG